MNPGPLRLLILDVDGTLVTADKRLHPEVRLAVRHALDSGLAVSLATGRMFSAVAGWVRELGLRTPQISNNGADLVDPATGEYLRKLTLAGDLAREALAFATEHHVTTAMFCQERVITLAKTADHWLIERNNEPVDTVTEAEMFAAGRVSEKLLFLDREHPERLPALREELVRRWTDAAGHLPCALEITEPGILNVCHPQATKLAALRALCERLGFSLAEVAAVGDSDNDAEILAAVGLGIAMGNATPASRAAAKLSVPGNDDIGVVTAICDHVLAGAPPTAAGTMARQLRDLRLRIRACRSAAVAFSGGVDSTLVLRLAAEELGTGVLAVTARSAVSPPADFTAACALAAELRVRHLVVDTDAENQAWYQHNPPDRCYLCKKAFMTGLVTLAQNAGLACVLDGENADDLRADRPGRRAAVECGVRSPLAETGLGKADIRAISRELGLPTWNRPSNPCLATRFPRGATLTPERLAAVAKAEDALHHLGFRELRVRVQLDLARIEVPRAALAEVVARAADVVAGVKACGFKFVTLDLEGYRTGSMDG